MTPTITFSQITFGDRIRSTYTGIEPLADSIAEAGLEVPIVLEQQPDSTYLLVGGGRRWHALQLLVETGRWDGTLEHAATMKVGRPGYVLKDRDASVNNKLGELLENLHRVDLDWRDEVRLIKQAWDIASRDAVARAETLYYHTFAAILKSDTIGYMDIRYAMYVHDELVAHPEKFKDCTTLWGAYKILGKESEVVLKNELASRVGKDTPSKPLVDSVYVTDVNVTSDDKVEVLGERVEIPVTPTIDLTSHFAYGNSLDRMQKGPMLFDHIICDPDFAVSTDALESNADGMAVGVAQQSVKQSLDELELFLSYGFGVCRGFCAFWYDLNHHEKIQNMLEDIGWLYQRWPVIWHKVDHRSNGAPQHNTCKDIEYVMIARKPNTTLAQVTTSSVISLPKGQAAKQFGHPFAKPVEVWLRLYRMLTLPGQSVFDPFMGSGSACVAAIRHGLNAYGCELQQQHHSSAILNIQAEYKNQLGGKVNFI